MKKDEQTDDVKIHKGTRNLDLVATWGRARKYGNKKRAQSSDKVGRKVKHKGQDDS